MITYIKLRKKVLCNVKICFFEYLFFLFSSFGGSTINDISKIEDLRKQTNFQLFIPSNFESASNFEIKVPSDTDQKKEVQMVLINYFNIEDSYVFGVRQLRNNSYITKEITEFDVKNNTKKTKKFLQKFSFEPRGELVFINGNKGWYEAYIGKNATGGMLRWIESDTFIELDTTHLSKSTLIKIAESMNEI